MSHMSEVTYKKVINTMTTFKFTCFFKIFRFSWDFPVFPEMLRCFWRLKDQSCSTSLVTWHMSDTIDWKHKSHNQLVPTPCIWSYMKVYCGCLGWQDVSLRMNVRSAGVSAPFWNMFMKQTQTAEHLCASLPSMMKADVEPKNLARSRRVRVNSRGTLFTQMAAITLCGSVCWGIFSCISIKSKVFLWGKEHLASMKIMDDENNVKMPEDRWSCSLPACKKYSGCLMYFILVLNEIINSENTIGTKLKDVCVW